MNIIIPREGFRYRETVFSCRPFMVLIKILPYERRNGIANAPIEAKIGTLSYSSTLLYFSLCPANPIEMSVTPAKVINIMKISMYLSLSPVMK
jgi:hypothetical protein